MYSSDYTKEIGLLIGIGQLGDAIWWGQAWGWTIACSVYVVVMFAITGLVLAKFVTPKPTM